MEAIEAGAIQLELKYCERCGALWLRPGGSDLVFCASCALVMAGLAPNSRFLNPRHSARLQAEEPAFWTEGGNA
jgi:hypothetical protein